VSTCPLSVSNLLVVSPIRSFNLRFKKLNNAYLQEEVRQEQHTPCALRELCENMEGQQGERRSIVRFIFVFWQDNAKGEEKET
jgi:hypothetical protein